MILLNLAIKGCVHRLTQRPWSYTLYGKKLLPNFLSKFLSIFILFVFQNHTEICKLGSQSGFSLDAPFVKVGVLWLSLMTLEGVCHFILYSIVVQRPFMGESTKISCDVRYYKACNSSWNTTGPLANYRFCLLGML